MIVLLEKLKNDRKKFEVVNVMDSLNMIWISLWKLFEVLLKVSVRLVVMMMMIVMMCVIGFWMDLRMDCSGFFYGIEELVVCVVLVRNSSSLVSSSFCFVGWVR